MTLLRIPLAVWVGSVVMIHAHWVQAEDSAELAKQALNPVAAKSGPSRATAFG